jgi:gluconokinase
MSSPTPPSSRGADAAATVVVVMGVAGSGKTTVGTALAVALGWTFVDADDHHPPASVAKMARGEPLDDADRAPWLDELRGIIADALVRGAGLVMACSALKQRYRARLAGGDGGGRVSFAHLVGPPELFRSRLAQRAGHFMKPAMLDSQLATHEPPSDAVAVDATQPVAAQVTEIRGALGL